MILKELGIPFEENEVALSKVKGPEYTKHNPNGRLPAIYDQNTGLTIWESGAIIVRRNSEHDQLISNLAIQEYLVDKYDKEHKLSFPAGTNEYYSTKQWMYFQVSGQGPYYGQAWYISFFPFVYRWF